MIMKTPNNLLDTVYEIEGLLHLLMIREDAPARLSELIKEKIRTLTQMSEEVDFGDRSDSPDYFSDAPDEERERKIDEYVTTENLTLNDNTSEEEDTEAEPDDSEYKMEPVDFSSDNREGGDVLDYSDDFMSEPLKEQTPVKHTIRFSLNDRFYYTRELFGGDTSRFNDTVGIIIGMNLFSEVEEYIYSTLKFDSENPAVISFMERVENAF